MTSSTGDGQLGVAHKVKVGTAVEGTSPPGSSTGKTSVPAASTSKKASAGHASTTPSSLHTSPLLTGSNGFSTPVYASVESSPREHQHSSSPRFLPATAQSPAAPMSVNVSSHTPISHASASTANGGSRVRASTSTLPVSAYPSASHTALINSLPNSAHIAAQAAAAAMAVSSSNHYYHRANGFQGAANQSSSSSPSSSTQVAMQNPFLFPHQLQQQLTYEKHTVELTNCIIAFLSPILPTEEEYRIKEATRRQLERLAGRVSPGAKLLAFGSMANGFALRNSDMDLCCLIAPPEGDGLDQANKAPSPSASELVEVLGQLIREETDYNVMPLPKARIPIIKINRASTADLPYEIACDIGFENRLALENTRLLLSYAMVDPPRLRTLVLFLKVWTKRRKLNSPYTGTLSSYGYTLMMIFFLSQVKRPAVLPNLQRIPPSSHATRSEEVTLNGHNIYFYDDVATLRKEWTSFNTENVGELLIDFFKFFSKEFAYSKDVISIRTDGGLTTKDGHTWSSELCIEDPFQVGYNVARTVTRDGLYTIRGEFMRASRILTTRTERVSHALAELCEERGDGLTRAPDSAYYQRQRASFAAPAALAMGSAGYGFDSRYLRDLTRRYDLSNSSTSGFGGSFAFEEMARGLGQAQKSSNVVAYPPTTAMLAPLSQITGLSPRQHLMRAGLRYDTPRRGQTGGPMNGGTASSGGNHVGSSARSEDGSSIYEKTKTKKSRASSNVSARTSPNLHNALPHGFLHPNSAIQGGYGVGEALAYGSEISFGSQRFQLHPQPSMRNTGRGERADEQRTPRSLSDGLNRSLSLPRPGMEKGEKRRSSTPLLSEPASPHNLLATIGLPEPSGHGFLEPSMAALGIRTGHSSSPRSSRSETSSGAGGKAGSGRVCSSQPSNTLTPDEDDGSFGLEDDQVSISDDTLDELARVSSASHLPHGQAPETSCERPPESDGGKEHAIRSWAASQSAGIHAKHAP